jgi:parallel beta-helix repeat protein
MRGKNGVYVIAGSLVFGLLLVNFIPVLTFNGDFRNSHTPVYNIVPPHLLQAYNPHDPISIDGDSNFSHTALAEGWVGDGSVDTPYVIEGLEIDRGGGAGHCINISNTRVHFTIRHCNLTGATVNPGAGIYLNNVSYGTILSNTCSSNRHGIYLIDSHINTLANNTCSSNVIGIYMYDSDFNIVEDNDCNGNSNYGMLQYYCDSNEIRKNICSSNGIDGVHAQYAVTNTFGNNTCNGNGRDGIRVWYHPAGNNLSNNTCNSNNWNGIMIYDNDFHWITATIANNSCSANRVGISVGGALLNVVNNIVTDSEEYGFELGCDESTISCNTVERSYIGFNVLNIMWSTLSHNRIVDTDTGIWVQRADECVISHNSVTEVWRYGFELEESQLSHLFLNDISIPSEFMDSGDWSGIMIGRNSYENNVTLNWLNHDYVPYTYTISDYETGLTNIIDRNFYDDYEGREDEDGIGDEPYPIHGSAGNSDLHPLVFPPFEAEWVEQPTDQVLDYWDQPFYYDLNATAPSAITWQVNDTLLFSIDSTGIIQSVSNLPVGSYGLRIVVTNLYGVAISKDIKLIVQEITCPEWIVGPSDVTLDFGEWFDYAVIATDQSGLIAWTLNNTVNFNLSVTHLNATGYENGWDLIRLSNTTILVQGVYALNISVSDPYGNSLHSVFLITILSQHDTTSPIWIVRPLNETLDNKTPFTQRLGAWDESGVHHWWLNDSTYFTIDEDGVIRNITLLEVGTYQLEVRAYDPFDNYCSAVLVVTVLEPTTMTPTTPTTTTSTTPTTTTGTAQNGFDSMTVLAFVGGAASAVIILIVFFLYRKKS